MIARLRQWSDRIDALSLRERALVLVVLMFLAWSIWDTFLMRPLDLEQKTQRAALDEQRNANLQLEKQMEELSLRQSHDPDAENRKLREQLQTQVATLNQTLHDETQDLIDPAIMSKVLEEMLSQQQGLRLVSMENLGAKPLLDGIGSSDPEAPEINMPGIYHHGLEIEISGDYISTLNYLKTLETMPWRLYWDSVDLQVTNYPEASVKIQVHTLSLRPGWIGL